MARNGLKKVVKTVKGKKRSVRRTYWVKSDPNAGKKKGFLRRHAGKLLGAAALAGGAYLAYKGARGFAAEAHHQIKRTGSRAESDAAIGSSLRKLSPIHALGLSREAREADRAHAIRHQHAMVQHFGTPNPQFHVSSPAPRPRGLHGVLSDVKEGMRSGIAGDRFRSYEQRDADRLARRGVSTGPATGGHIQRLMSHTERGGNDSGHNDSQWYRRLGGTVGEQGNKRPISQRFRSSSLSNLDL